MHKLVSAEAGMRGTVVALWGVTFVSGMVGYIALFHVEAAVVAGIVVLFFFSVATSFVWWVYRDVMLKRLKNHSV
jgi:Flp pilus assembly protein TadB